MRISEEDGKNKLYLWLSIYNKKFEKKLQQKTSNTTAKDDEWYNVKGKDH